jgi:hypothetical protein
MFVVFLLERENMTTAQIVSDLKDLIGPGIDVSDAGLKNWVNDAYFYVCDAITQINPHFFAKSALTSTMASQQEYALPSDFDKLLIANIDYGSGWVRALPLKNAGDIGVLADSTTMTQGYDQSQPYYYILGNNIGFMPVPETTTSNKIRLWYSYIPSELDDADSPLIPTKYHRYLKYFSYANYLDQDDEHVAAERLRQRYDVIIERIATAMEHRDEDQPRSVEITHGQDLYISDGMPY